MMNSMDINAKIIDTINLIDEANSSYQDNSDNFNLNNNLMETKSNLYKKYESYSDNSIEDNDLNTSQKIINISGSSNNNINNTYEIENDDEKEFKTNNYSYERYIDNPSNIKYLGINNNYKKMTIKYQTDIAKLKTKIAVLQKESHILSNKIEEGFQKKEALKIEKEEKEKKEAQLLHDIQTYFNLSNKKEILSQFDNILNKIGQKDKLREELIEKIKNSYIKLSGTDEKKEDIDIQILWRWIKHLIKITHELSEEKEKNLITLNELNQYEQYNNNFTQIMDEFHLNNIEELKLFINNLLSINNMNKKRVQKLKKVLLDTPERTNSEN